MLSNIGIVSNKGVEIALSGRIVEAKDFKLDATVNISKNKNEIKELYNEVESITVTSGLGLSKYLKVGESLLSIYGLKSEGIIKTEGQLAAYQKIVPTAQLGDEMYADIDDDKAITAKDQINIGETEPNFFYGVALNLEYKKFHLDILRQGAPFWRSWCFKLRYEDRDSWIWRWYKLFISRRKSNRQSLLFAI